MGYMHIENLYKNKTILLFKQCYALEKIHGTSAHISFRIRLSPDQEANYIYNIDFFSGGEKYENFINLFNKEKLMEEFVKIFNLNNSIRDIIIFGEAYGGKQQGMSGTYGKDLKFIAFDVKIGDNWLRVPEAENICKQLGIEFVHYDLTDTDLKSLNKIRETNSIQAIRNGLGENKKREGIVLRPLIELKDNKGERIISKYKNDEFRETSSIKEVEKSSEILVELNKIVDEWVTETRLNNILSKLSSCNKIEDTGIIIKAMIEDVLRESSGEIKVENEGKLKKAIAIKTAKLFKKTITEIKNEI